MSIAGIDADTWVDTAVYVERTWSPDTPKIAQKGVLRDLNNSNVRIEFVIWERSKISVLKEDRRYLLEDVIVDRFKGEKYISINSNSNIEDLDF